MKNKTFFIVLAIALFVVVISTFSYFVVTGNAVNSASAPGDGRSWLCRMSVDFCDCTPTIPRCVNSNSYTWKGKDCVTRTGYCSSGQTCSGGQCVVADSCSDTDGGINYTTQGTVSGYNGTIAYSYTDYCVNSSTLSEYYCNGVQASKLYVGCQYGCSISGGVCLTQTLPDLIIQYASSYNAATSTIIVVNVKNIGGSTAGLRA